MTQDPQLAGFCWAEQSVLQAISSTEASASLLKIEVMIHILYIQLKDLISRAACKGCLAEKHHLW